LIVIYFLGATLRFFQQSWKTQGRAIQYSAFAPVPFLSRQSKSIYRFGGKSLLAQQRRLLPAVVYFLSLARHLEEDKS